MLSVGASTAELGCILFISTLLELALRIPFGMISDRMGRYFVLAVGLATQLLSTILLYLTVDLWWLYPATILQSISITAFSPVALAYASDLAKPDQRGRDLGLYMSSFGISMFLGPFVGGILTQFFSLNTVFLVTSMFPLISLLIFISIGTRVQKVRKDSKGTIRQLLSSVNSLMLSRNTVVMLLGRIGFNFPLFVFSTIFPIYAEQNLMLSTSMISLLFAVQGAANMLVRLPVGILSDRIGRKGLYIMASLCPMIAFIIASSTRYTWLILVMMVIYGVGWGMGAVLSSAIVTDSISSRVRGMAMSLYYTSIGIGKSLGSLTISSLISLLPLSSVFQFLPLLSFVDVIPALLLQEHQIHTSRDLDFDKPFKKKVVVSRTFNDHKH
jgi:MFS family permease